MSNSHQSLSDKPGVVHRRPGDVMRSRLIQRYRLRTFNQNRAGRGVGSVRTVGLGPEALVQ
jgi:hypothetical protein